MDKPLVGYRNLGLFCALFGLTFVGKTLAATCNRLLGPSGLVECVNLYPLYSNRSQWATCLTDSYIRQKSKGQHACIDTRTIYCWYQCMIETHNVGPGSSFPAPVYEDCECDGLGTTQRPYSTSPLPNWCFSPSGQECSWYRQCLEERYPCQGTPASYAITYAEKFCNLYSDHAPKFTQAGQNWINAVRKCLQVALVPIIRPWVTISCEGIKQIAVNSHSGCYLNPYAGAPSICDLPASDWFRSFWTIKAAFKSAFVESLQGILDVLKGCAGNVLDNLQDMVKIKFNIERKSFKRQKRSTSDELDELAGAVVDAIALQLDWRDSGIMWYAYSNSSNLTSIVPVEVIIAGQGTYDLNTTKVSDFNLTAVTNKVAKAVQDGDLFFSNIGNKFEPIYVTQMKECIDFECQRVTQEFTAPPNKHTSAAFGLSNNMMYTVFTLFIYLYLIVVQ